MQYYFSFGAVLTKKTLTEFKMKVTVIGPSKRTESTQLGWKTEVIYEQLETSFLFNYLTSMMLRE